MVTTSDRVNPLVANNVRTSYLLRRAQIKEHPYGKPCRWLINHTDFSQRIPHQNSDPIR